MKFFKGILMCVVMLFGANLAMACDSISSEGSTSQADSTGSNANSSVVGSNVNSSVSESNVIADWSEATKEIMVEALNQVIPVAPVTSEYDATLEDWDGDKVILIIDENCDNIVAQYSQILDAASYTNLYEGEDLGDYAYYYKMLDDVYSLDIEFMYDEDGFFLSAFLYDNTVLQVEDWYAEDVEIMMQVIGEELPLAALTEYYYFFLESDEDGYFFIVYDFVAFEELYDYGLILESEAGFEFDGSEELEDGYAEYYVKEHETLEAYVCIDLFFYADGTFVLQGYLYGEQLLVD